MKFNMEIEVTSDDIADSALRLSQDQAVDLVMAIDLRFADCGFTEALIKKLVSSLKRDVDAGADDIDLPFIDWQKVEKQGERLLSAKDA